MLKVLMLLAVMQTTPAFAAEESSHFELRPPIYSIPSAQKHAEKRKNKAIRWFNTHLKTRALQAPDGKVKVCKTK